MTLIEAIETALSTVGQRAGLTFRVESSFYNPDRPSEGGDTSVDNDYWHVSVAYFNFGGTTTGDHCSFHVFENGRIVRSTNREYEDIYVNPGPASIEVEVRPAANPFPTAVVHCLDAIRAVEKVLSDQVRNSEYQYEPRAIFYRYDVKTDTPHYVVELFRIDQNGKLKDKQAFKVNVKEQLETVPIPYSRYYD